MGPASRDHAEVAEPRCVVLTGGPGAGKSTVARLVAQQRLRCAVVEVDDLRHMLVRPHVAPWQGPEGHRQQLLGAGNACDLVRNFRRDGCEVLVADVLTTETTALYRSGVEGITVVQLLVTVETAIERARRRTNSLTEQEMRHLHAEQSTFTDADVSLDTEQLGVDGVVQQVGALLL